MLTLRCSKCKKKLFKYEKIGEGRLLHLWKNRIKEVYHINKLEDKYFCECGNLIGIDNKIYIRLKKGSFTYTGEIIK
ncbi:MAG: hypothetical protein H5U37_01915 [Caldisericia bacterium]|nr:hypothetical protein [Caldisericia bacterium]